MSEEKLKDVRYDHLTPYIVENWWRTPAPEGEATPGTTANLIPQQGQTQQAQLHAHRNALCVPACMQPAGHSSGCHVDSIVLVSLSACLLRARAAQGISTSPMETKMSYQGV